MRAGKLKMWNADRGFGFIADDAGGPDMFLHVNEVKTAGIDPGQDQNWRSTDFRNGQHSRWQDESQQRSHRVTFAAW
jgi:CspA family cold shock protein